MKRMKKLIFIGLVLLLVLSMAACSKTDQIKEELSGSWSYSVQSIDGICIKTYNFSDDGKFECTWVNVNAPFKNSDSAGTYEIKDSEIILTEADSSTETIITYTFRDGELELTDVNSDRSGSHTLYKD